MANIYYTELRQIGKECLMQTYLFKSQSWMCKQKELSFKMYTELQQKWPCKV